MVGVSSRSVSRRTARFYAPLTIAAVLSIPIAVTQPAAAATTSLSVTVAAFSSTKWSLEPTANPLVRDETVSAIACPGATTCFEVGGLVNTKGASVAAANEWNGNKWTLLSTPNPAKSITTGLNSISCPSAKECVAVGSAESSGSDPIAETWNGTTWALDAVSVPPSGGLLDGVSCPKTNYCMAVGLGLSGSGFEALSEVWNGTKWTPVSVPVPARGSNPELESVSCTSSSDCEAVGSYGSKSFPQTTLAEIWNGKSWKVQAAETPSGGLFSSLEGVLCQSSGFCMAVGSSLSGSGDEVSLTEDWKGSKWTIVATPVPKGSIENLLSGVSCASPSSCTAVGSDETETGAQASLAEGWNGKKWSIEVTPTVAGATGTLLSGVSCASASTCVAAGNTTTTASPSSALAEGWNGRAWSVQAISTPLSLVPASLSGVSCVSNSSCVAVGSDEFGNPISETWNGKAWTFNPSSLGLGGGSLSRVSCTSPTACIAVGQSNSGAPLAGEWNGKTWKALGTAPEQGTLIGVSCISSSFCMAVGVTINESTGVPGGLAETWNGKSWVAIASPSPAGSQETEILSVSCSSARSCAAVGVWYDAAGEASPLTESWNGKTWTLKKSAGVAGEILGLTGVSCSSATSCIATGYPFNRLGSPAAFSETWNGSKWSAVTIPTPVGGAVLYGLGCASADSCVTVGGNGTGALAEGWNGKTWSIEDTVNPPGSGETSYLNGVSCSTASSCTAVGDYVNSDGVTLTLAETG